MIEIIPAIDIIDGKCVRLEKGDYGKKKIYSEDPLETALLFESLGIRHIHLVDLDGAKAGEIVNLEVLKRIAEGTGLTIDFGGGIRRSEDVRLALDNGASMVTGGSIAVKNQEEFLNWMMIYGSDKIILGADHNKGKISTNGWLEDSETGLFAFLENYIAKGVRKIICTDIQRDGMLSGPSLGLYAEILEKWPGTGLIASGGVSSMDDIMELDRAGVPAVIVGKALYENRITPVEIKKALAGK